MSLSDQDELQLIRDVAEIKGMLSSSLASIDTRVETVEQSIEESRRVHTVHDQALAAHGARLAVVENTAESNRARLEKAGDQTRANVSLVVAILALLASVTISLGPLIVNAT